jgi:hypothetical protein
MRRSTSDVCDVCDVCDICDVCDVCVRTPSSNSARYLHTSGYVRIRQDTSSRYRADLKILKIAEQHN